MVICDTLPTPMVSRRIGPHFKHDVEPISLKCHATGHGAFLLPARYLYISLAHQLAAIGREGWRGHGLASLDQPRAGRIGHVRRDHCGVYPHSGRSAG